MRNDLGRSINLLGLVLMLAGPTTAAEFTELGDLPGGEFYSVPAGLSDDGSVVVGWSYPGYGFSSREAFRWTPTGGMVAIGAGPRSSATDVSAGGSVVVGAFGQGAFRWTQETGAVRLEDLPGGRFSSGTAVGVSADRLVVAVRGRTSVGAEAFRWTAENGMVGLGSLPGDSESHALGISADGSTVVGYAAYSSGVEPFRWTPAGGMQAIGAGTAGEALDASTDGSVVVGSMWNSAGDRQAFRWTEEAGMAGLGDLPGDPFFSRALAVSADGSIVVGESNGYYWDFSSKAFIWDAENGMRALQAVLITDFQLGPSLEGWTLHGARAIAADGRVIVGSGTNPSGQTEAWRAVIPEPSTLVGLLSLGAVGLLACVRRRRRR